MAQELAETLNFDEVRFIPAASPPHKDTSSISVEHRSTMVRLAIANNPIFTFDDCELKRTGASYTIDTLLSLREELGTQTSITLFMGSDAFTQFHTWHRWQEIIQHCHIALVQRPLAPSEANKLPKILETFLHNHYTENSDDLHTSPAGFVTMRQITALDISSTAIRESFKHGYSARYLMPECVIEYIHTKKLYKQLI
jgi:nicotinate-nucleotide adenylyltransferase